MSEQPSFQLVSEMLFYLLKHNGIDPLTVSVQLDFDNATDARKMGGQITREFRQVMSIPADRELNLEEDFRMHNITYRVDGGWGA